MSCITESLARGLANNVKRDAADRFRKAQGVLDTYCTIPHAKGPIWRHTLEFARGMVGAVIFERHTGEKSRAEATLVGMVTDAKEPGIAFRITRINARDLFKGKDSFVEERLCNAFVTKHAQSRAIQALGPDVRVYGRELAKHAAVAQNHQGLAATFSDLGIALWRDDQGLATCTTFIPADRLDKWAAPYARWQSGRDVDGVVSAARTMDEVIALGGVR